MKKFKSAFIPVLFLIASIAILYARTFIVQDNSDQSIPSHTSTKLTDNKITIHYHERPPYYITGSLDVYGLCSDPVKFAFKKAGIAFSWEKTPVARQLDIIKNNRSNACIIGWFNNPEREKFAQFSHYIYQDKPTIALSRADNDKLLSNKPLEEILHNPHLVLLKKKGYSYGQFIDAKIAKLNPEQEVTISNNIGMLKMILLKRADYFFISKEEAMELIDSSGLLKSQFKFIKFSDMPKGNKRYLLFSKKVDEQIIEKINTALKEYIHSKS